MKNKRKTSLVLLVAISICLILPLTTATAQKNKDPVMVYTVPAFLWGEEFIFDVQDEPMPNGFTKVDMKLNFYWLSEPFNGDLEANILGTAIQHVTGIRRDNGVESLHGTGVYTSTISDKPGTITYTIGNNWDGGDIMWAGRLRIVEGTETFEDVKGPAELNFELMAFELYLHTNPWSNKPSIFFCFTSIFLRSTASPHARIDYFILIPPTKQVTPATLAHYYTGDWELFRDELKR